MARTTTAGLIVLVALIGCGGGDTRWDKANQDTRGKKAVAAEAVEGGAFNKFFPKEEATKAPFDFVFKQEKKGFAQASLKKDGKEVATFAITDALDNPEAKTDFVHSTEKFLAAPIIKKGEKGTAILVADRFQVTVRSMDPSFTEADRKNWLEKFDLIGLAGLK